MEYDEAALQTVRETRLLIDRYDAWLFNEFATFLGNRILEIGCGHGNLFVHLLDREFVAGIETSQRSVEYINRQFATHDNVIAMEADITDDSALTLKQYTFDTVVSLNVFEHIEHDNIAIAHTCQILQPNGTFILIVPAHMGLYGTMDRSIGHFRRYDKTMLKRQFERAGFKVLTQKYLNMLGAAGWFVNGRLFKRHVPPSGQLKLLNVLIPFLETVESRMSPPFGVSVMTVGQKR